MQSSPENEITSLTSKPGTEPVAAIALLPEAHSNMKLYIGFIAAILVAVFLMTYAVIFASRDSLPGDTLYTFKTNVAEELTAFTKLSATAQTDFALSRIETRLTELQTVARDNATTSPEVLSSVGLLIHEHTDTTVSAVEGNTEISPEVKLETLIALTNLTRSIELYIDSVPEFTPMSEQIDENESFASDALSTNVQNFASSSEPSVVIAFLTELVTQVGEELPNVANGSRAQKIAISRLNDTNDAIADGDMVDAINSVLKAQQAIAIDAYLYDSERGPVDGITPEALPMPEGS